MAELVVVAFDDKTQADLALSELKRLEQDYWIDLEDAVVAHRGADGQVQLQQSVSPAGRGAMSGGLWGGVCGALVGLLLLNPLVGFALGTAVGAGTGALSGQLTDYGIDDDFIGSLAHTLPPGGSAVFVLLRQLEPDRLLAALSPFEGRVLRSSLNPEQEARLQAALGSTRGTAHGSSGAATV
ncbi:DUF1269 domain-containing protein [Caldimonas brevitalea]|uniref:Membrane protein n=1 Tax=Caldimonas brevitalea TaxID=413882 RepID=A0A0G3BHA4_9BURK|nr:DUF1269 domain-containing protein [Caldimonas brevitalea]AKJ27348.1 membrane protein [Caldimonas brevitalea]